MNLTRATGQPIDNGLQGRDGSQNAGGASGCNSEPAPLTQQGRGSSGEWMMIGWPELVMIVVVLGIVWVVQKVRGAL